MMSECVAQSFFFHICVESRGGHEFEKLFFGVKVLLLAWQDHNCATVILRYIIGGLFD